MAVTGYANSTYRWRTGFVNASQLTSTYNITSFPKFDDMGGHVWFNPEGIAPYNQGALSEQTLAGDANFLGLENVVWTLTGLTPEMVNYVLHNAALFNSAASMDSTISTWNRGANQWEVVWAKSRIGTLSEVAEVGYSRGLLRLTINHLVQQDAP
jgi:hypothetical protein